MKEIQLYGEKILCEETEFEYENYEKYNNLKILKKLGNLEKLEGFINDLSEIYDNNTILLWIGGNHGNIVPINCSAKYKKVYIISLDEKLDKMTEINKKEKKNIEIIKINKIQKILNEKNEEKLIVYSDRELLLVSKKIDYMITTNKISETKYQIDEYYIYPNLKNTKDLEENFRYYFQEGKFNYDNLINFCMIVKNGGELFQKMLKENYHLIDRWTIIDTGSDDGTVEFIEEFLKNKKGKLYREEFEDFDKTRNKCLDYAGDKCKYNIMLDDTYIVQGKLREFLNKVRGDQFSNSFSLYIRSGDNEYVSNRITKSRDKLRYIFKIHEVIDFENNINIIIPQDEINIIDERSEYMEKRTMNRKQKDLELLLEEHRENPNIPRHLYYIAQTYSLLQEYEKAAEYFEKRINHENPGFIPEKFDACFELARLYNFKLNKSWEICEKKYLEAYEIDNTRPESFYFIGIHYYLTNQKEIAYKYFVKSFELGYPLKSQYSLKPTLSFYFLPKFLVELCLEFKNPILGLEASNLFLNKNDPKVEFYNAIINFKNIFKNLIDFENKQKDEKREKLYINQANSNKKIVFVADGGFEKWNGSSILSNGVGGSETFIIELSRNLARNKNLEIFVFCRCVQEEIFENVNYLNIEKFHSFIQDNFIDTVIVSRYFEYLPTSYLGNVDNVYLILHDLCSPESILLSNIKLKNIICLSDWHEKHFHENFPNHKNLTKIFNYGIDKTFFCDKIKTGKKFIYSSFPNRGLTKLLEMWNTIYEKYPESTLDLFVDLNNNWVNKYYSDDIEYIKFLLSKLKNVFLHGWVDKITLRKAWENSDIWFYPCIFQETFCLTALEAAASNTLVITNDLAALKNTVDDRGIIIPGDPNDSDWQNRAIQEIFEIFENPEKRSFFIQKNKKWALNLDWEKQSHNFYNNFINFSRKIGLFNWTDDLPIGSKNIFENILYQNKDNIEKILEIGSYTGISLIRMLEICDKASAYAVDNWENYLEFDTNGMNKIMSNIESNNIQNIFIENIKLKNFDSRIKIFKDDSFSALIKFIEKKERFDLIYVDASHLMFDSFMDIMLSWKLLNKNGLLIIDDVLFENNKQNILENFINKPLLSVDYFLKRFFGQYLILENGYRLFLKKI